MQRSSRRVRGALIGGAVLVLVFAFLVAAPTLLLVRTLPKEPLPSLAPSICELDKEVYAGMLEMCVDQRDLLLRLKSLEDRLVEDECTRPPAEKLEDLKRTLSKLRAERDKAAREHERARRAVHGL